MSTRVKLEDVCERGSSNLRQSDVEGKTGGYPIYGAAGYVGNVDFFHQDKPYVAVVKDGAGIGRTTLLPAKSSVIGTMQYLLPKENVLPEYLCYVVRHMRLEKYFLGAAIPHIYFRDYKNEEFNLDNLGRQAEIVDILSRVEKTIDMRQQELATLDYLIKARFVEMFGDPISNAKGFKTKLGSDVFKLSNGKFVPKNKRFKNGIPTYGGNGVSWYTDDVLFEKDTIVVGRVGFQSGNVHFVNGPLWISDNAMYISEIFDEEFDLRFLYFVMEHIDFTRFQDAGDLKKITQKPFMATWYIKPPLQKQLDYIAFVAQTNKSKVAVQKALDETQLLFDSLMQKYFG